MYVHRRRIIPSFSFAERLSKNKCISICIVLAIMLSSVCPMSAQSDLGSYFMKNTWAAFQLNPSFSDSSKLHIAIPVLHTQAYHSLDVGFQDIIFNNNGRNVLSFDGVLDALDPTNNFESSLDLQTIGVAIKLGQLGINFSHRLRFESQLTYPEELIRLIFDGNSQFIGETVSFGPSLSMNSFHELALGGNFNLMDKLSIGARVKFLSGIGAINTSSSKATLFTSDDIYQLTFDVDYALQSASFVDISGVSDFNFDVNTLNFSNLNFENSGIGFDLGLHYEVSDKLSLSASVIDLGNITWSENVDEFRSQGTFEYDGIDLSNFLVDDGIDFEIKLDTLEEIFAFQQTANTSFESQLKSSFYIGGDYRLNNNIQLGVLYRNVFANGLNRSSVAVNAQYIMNQWLLLGGHFIYHSDINSSIGLQAMVKLGPVQIYGSTDAVLGLLGNSNQLNGRLGLGLLF